MKRQPQIFFGLGSGSRVLEDSAVKVSVPWTEEEEQAYLDKVRQRAQDKAQEILNEALKDAQAQKEQARAAGYEEGMKLAASERQEQLAVAGERLHDIFISLTQEKRDIWQGLRDDILKLARLSVEKILHIEMAERRKEILTSLLDEAIATFENQHNVRIYVHPDDMESIQEMVRVVEQKNADPEMWQIDADAGLAPGGVRLESFIGMVENSISARKAEVDAIWEQISLDAQSGDRK